MDIKDKYILGLDPGSRTMGWGILQNHEKIASGFFPFRKDTKLKYPYMLKSLNEQVTDLLKQHKLNKDNCIVVLEAQFSGIPKELLGSIKQSLVLTDSFEIIEIGAKENKRIFTGNGTAEKEEMMATVVKIFKYNVTDDNEADAIALAYSLDQWLYEHSLSKEDRKELIKKARKARKKDKTRKKSTKAKEKTSKAKTANTVKAAKSTTKVQKSTMDLSNIIKNIKY